MKSIGIGLPTAPPPPDHVVDGAFVAREAERLGFDSVWFPEHVTAPVEVTQSHSPIFQGGQVPGFVDPLILMGRASAVTSTIKLGTGVLLITEHHPLQLAKAVATLDLYSGGRIILGIGPGWLREEAVLFGVDFDHRWTQSGEAVRALKELWTKDESEFHGKYYDFPPVRCFPKPVQKPHPPVLLGGVATNVLKRTVAYGDGWMPNRIEPDEFKVRAAELRELAAAAGRDPKSIQISVHGKEADPDLVGAFFEAGADAITVNMREVMTAEREVTERMEKIAKTVLPVAKRF